MGDIFKEITTVKATLQVIDGFVKDEKNQRYSVTRWNSKYATIIQANEKNLFDDTLYLNKVDRF